MINHDQFSEPIASNDAWDKAIVIRYVNPQSRLVPAVVISAECSRNTIRIQLKKV